MCSRRRRRFRHLIGARFHLRSSAGAAGLGHGRVSAAPQEGGPDHATQSHADHMNALVSATRKAIAAAGIRGKDDPGHRARHHRLQRHSRRRGTRTARRLLPLVRPSRQGAKPRDITETAHAPKSWRPRLVRRRLFLRVGLRQTAALAAQQSGEARAHGDRARALRHGGGRALRHHRSGTGPRSVCAMGHKWMWNEALGGLPSEEFLTKVDPLLAGVRGETRRPLRHLGPDLPAHLTPDWAEKLGLQAGHSRFPSALSTRTGTPSARAAAKATWSTWSARPPASWRSRRQADLIPGVCGVVKGSIHPRYFGIEAGLSATGDIFDAIAQPRRNHRSRSSRKGSKTIAPARPACCASPGTTATAPCWSIPNWAASPSAGTSRTPPQDELFAAIEGTAFHTRIILERMAEHGVPIRRVINGGGIPQKNETLNRVYANVLGKPVLVPEGEVTSLGSAIFAFLAAGRFKTIEEAQERLCPEVPRHRAGPARTRGVRKAVYSLSPGLFRAGQPDAPPAALGHVLPELRRIAAAGR